MDDRTELFKNAVDMFATYRDTAAEIEGVDIARVLAGKPSVDELVKRNLELESEVGNMAFSE